MIIHIEPDFVAWINETVARHGIQVELVKGDPNRVCVTTRRGHQHHEVRDNSDLGQLMAAVIECEQAQERGAAMTPRAEVAA